MAVKTKNGLEFPFDFANAETVKLLPLEKSFTRDEVEKELKDLFISLFKSQLGKDFFDVNVLGVKHLGSFDLVRKTLNADGLTLLRGDNEEQKTRYIYRAWMAGNAQGRGTHFLKTYLQLHFAESFDVNQLWQRKDEIYPLGVHQANEIPKGESIDDYFLTSRINVEMDIGQGAVNLKTLARTIRSILPARLIPDFRFVVYFDITLLFGLFKEMTMNKDFFITVWGTKKYVSTDPLYNFIVEQPASSIIGEDIYQQTIGAEKSIELKTDVFHRVGEPNLYVNGCWLVKKDAPFTLGMEFKVT